MFHARPARIAWALLGAAFLASPSLLALHPLPAVAADAPKAVLDRLVLDWGVASDQDALKGEVKISNTGNAPLQILECKPSCGCVRPKIRGDKRFIAAGEEVVIDVEFEPLNKQGPVKDLYFTLRTNDPDSPAQRVDIKCDVKPTVGIESPDGLSLGSLDSGAAKSLTFFIFGRAPDFKATFATISAEDGFSVKVGETTEAEVRGDKVRRAPVTVTAQANARPGRFSHAVVIRHSDKRIRNGLWELSVTGEVLNDVRPVPAESDLGALAMAEDFAAKITLTNIKGAPFKVVSAKYLPTKGGPIEISTASAAGDKPEALVLSVSGKAPARPGSCEGTLQITTDVKGMPPVKIPFRLTVRVPQQPTDGN